MKKLFVITGLSIVSILTISGIMFWLGGQMPILFLGTPVGWFIMLFIVYIITVITNKRWNKEKEKP